MSGRIARPVDCWHYGIRRATGKRVWWVNSWLAHPCADLALPWEIGQRAAAALGDL